MNSQSRQFYEFGPFRLDSSQHSLQRDGQAVPLEPKVFDLLKVLVQNNGSLLQKEELLKEIWPDTFVEEGNLNRNISILRKVLGEDPSGRSYIETVPRRGYRFVASVKEIAGNGFGTTGIELADRDAKVTNSDLLQAGAKRDPERGIFSARRWLVLGGVVIAIAALIFVVMRHGSETTAPRIQSLAVLPLQNLSGDPAQDYFAEGMTEALISSLGQIRALRVISRTSMMTFKGTRKTLPEIARELGVDGVIEGSVQQENGRVKMMVQLIQGPTDTHLWARDYERALTDVLKLQGEMARAVAEEIRTQVTPEELALLASAPTVNPAAHQEYLLGRYHFWKFIVDDNQLALDHFERAVQMDPAYAPAYAGLSMAWQRWAFQGPGTWKEAEPQARAAIQKALELDDRNPEAYVAQGQLLYRFDWDWKCAENAIRRALELDPKNLDAHFNNALLQTALGHLPEALTEIQTVEQLDPLSHQVQVLFGRILLRSGKPEEAILRLKRAIEREPRSVMAHGFLGEVYEEMGRYEEALAIYTKHRVLKRDPPNNPRSLAILARVYARMGKRNEAKGILKALEPHKPDLRAAAYAALGENDEAFRLLFQKVQNREETLYAIKTDRRFASLHSDPRWQELLRRMNFPQE